MGKNPAILFYPGDYSVGVRYLSYEQQGIYVAMLCFQFDNDFLTIEDIREFFKDEDHFNEVWHKLSRKFESQDGQYWNERWREEMIKRKIYTQSRGNNRRGGKKALEKVAPTPKIKKVPGYLQFDESKYSVDQIAAFDKFNKWVDENTPRVRQLKDQITIANFLKMIDTYSKELIVDILGRMDNYKKLVTSYVSVYKTFLTWAKKTPEVQSKVLSSGW